MDLRCRDKFCDARIRDRITELSFQKIRTIGAAAGWRYIREEEDHTQSGFCPACTKKLVIKGDEPQTGWTPSKRTRWNATIRASVFPKVFYCCYCGYGPMVAEMQETKQICPNEACGATLYVRYEFGAPRDGEEE